MKYFIKNILATTAKRIKETIAARTYVVILLLLGMAASSAMTVQSGSLANPFGSVSAKPTAPPASRTPLMAGKLPGTAIPVSIDQSTLNKMPRFIVKFRDNSREFSDPTTLMTSINKAANTVTSNQRSAPLSAQPDFRLAIGADLIKLNRLITPAESNSFLTTLRSNPSVEYAEIDAAIKGTMYPNDTSFHLQWGLKNQPYAMNLPDAWDNSTGVGIVVAVIDSGYTDHSDLDHNTVTGYDFISDKWAALDDNGRDTVALDEGNWCQQEGLYSDWHGTHVGGIIGAVANNAKGVTGVAFQAKIQPIRVLGVCNGGMTSDFADAIVWASGGTVKNIPNNTSGAQIINLSFGSIKDEPCPETMQKAIDFAVNKGMLVIAGAGNKGVDVANSHPANCKGVLSVGYTDASGKRALKSNYGKSLGLVAPGIDIYSTSNLGTTSRKGESYAYSSGSSMAAPLVSGTAALVWSKLKASCPANATADRVRDVLRNTAIPSPYCLECGAGIVNAALAVKGAIDGLPPSTDFNYSISGFGIDVSGTISNCKGGITQYVINYGDGATSSGNTTNYFNANHVYSQPGTYTITVTVMDNGNAVGISSQSVYISGYDTTRRSPL